MPFHIAFSSERRDGGYSLAAAGETLTIDGAVLDLSVIPEGATLPAEAVDCPWIAPGSNISRIAGVLHLTLTLPYGPIPWPAPPESRVVTHPDPIIVTGDGPVILPSYTEPETEPQPEEDPQ